MLVLRDLNETLADEYWIADLIDGSLNEEALTNLGYLGKATTNPVTDPYRNNSVSCFKIGNGRYVMSVVRSTDPNAACVLRCQKVVGNGTSTTLTNISSWNISGYAGLFTGQSTVRISDKFLGTTAEKCELARDGGDAITVGFIGPGNLSVQLEVIQNPNSLEVLHLLVRREVKLTSGESTVKYVADMTYRMTISNAGVGALTATSRYLNNRPTVKYEGTDFVYTNKRKTFVNHDGLTNELITVLKDGSIMLVGDKAVSESTGEIALYASPAGYTNISALDLHAVVEAKVYKAKQVLSVRPGYNPASNPTYALYIASPIKVYMGGMDFEIPAQTLDLTTTINGQSAFNITDIPYGKGYYSGINVRAAYIYAQQSGTIGKVTVSPRELSETTGNALVAIIFFPTSGAPSLLYAQSYSRMSKYRLSYEPQGAAVPVSYDNPAQKPVAYWLQDIALGGEMPTFWKDAACTVPAGYAVNGKVLYIRVRGAQEMLNKSYRMQFNGVDLGVKTYTGSPLVWSVTVSYTSTTPKEVIAVVQDSTNGAEITRAFITAVNATFGLDVVTSDGGEVTTQQIQRGFTAWVRIQGYDLNTGDTVAVTTTGAQSLTVGSRVYQGYPLYFPISATNAGSLTINGRNTRTGDLSAPYIVQVTDPIREYGPGQYTLTVEPGRSIEYVIGGAGGGGGGYISNRSGNWDVAGHGGRGGDSKLTYLAASIIAAGGMGGTDAHWFSETAYTIGTPGQGGVVTSSGAGGFTVTRAVSGNSGTAQTGGAGIHDFAPVANNGKGGNGGGPTIIPPTTTTVERSITQFLTGNPTATETYNGKTYKVYRGVELYSEFVKHFGRAPNSGEMVRITIPGDIALVGADAGNVAGLTISNSWPKTSPIEIVNNGLIIGVGGNPGDYKDPGGSTGHVHTNIRAPGAGIHNQSTAAVTLTRKVGSVVAGGGGGGGAIPGEVRRGGGGAPYGIGGKNYRQDGSPWPEDGRYGIDNGEDGLFATGGKGGYYNSGNYGGAGGAWGVAGGNGREGIRGIVGPGQAPGAETIGLNNSFTKVTEIAINTMVTGTTTGVYAGKTYTILRGVNLRDAFVNHFKRAPESGELVRVTVPDNIAVVGNTTITQGLLVPANWEAGAMVEIINRGLIFGVGGNGNGARYANGQPTIDGTNGGTGVHNLSTSLVTITNYGGIAGGGGGGARGSNYLPGGGGAPFGLKGVVTGVTINPAVNATDATFAAPGVGASDPSNSSRAGGAGGTVGTDGLTVIVPQWMNYYGNQYGTLAGYIAEGKVSVTNLDNGWTLGRPIQGGAEGSIEPLVRGGGGGSGGLVEGRFTNSTNAPVTIDLVVGAGGSGWSPSDGTIGFASEAGRHGYARISFV